ncbi:uncharacterized protein [Henckelia pumila]|uniref:uncharacterized protein isoform X2 n=1 Tax=Henckelia pumila TaxID=405737 RepID=UPI003C6E3086
MKMEHRASSRPSLDIQALSSVDGDDMETQGFDTVPTFFETLPLSGIILQKHIHDNPISATTKKEGDGRTNKRKNGSSAKERNAEKKKRKRAEKNRKLGIKRLKLQTVSQPKKIMYCRHYLQGKCHEVVFYPQPMILDASYESYLSCLYILDPATTFPC